MDSMTAGTSQPSIGRTSPHSKGGAGPSSRALAGIAAACVLGILVGTTSGLMMLNRSRAPDEGQLIAAGANMTDSAEATEPDTDDPVAANTAEADESSATSTPESDASSEKTEAVSAESGAVATKGSPNEESSDPVQVSDEAAEPKASEAPTQSDDQSDVPTADESGASTSPELPLGIRPADAQVPTAGVCETAQHLTISDWGAGPPTPRCLRVNNAGDLHLYNDSSDEVTIEMVNGPFTIGPETSKAIHAFGASHEFGVHRFDASPHAFPEIWVVDPSASLFSSVVLTPRGMGPIEAGMTVEQAIAASADLLSIGDDDASEGCRYAMIPGDPYSPWFMVLDGEGIVRVDAGQGVRTETGVGFGTAEADVYRAYPGQTETAPHVYGSDDDTYITVTPTDPADANYRIVFEIIDGKVLAMRSGIEGPVSWIEGCA